MHVKHLKQCLAEHESETLVAQLCPTPRDPHGSLCDSAKLLCPWDSPGKNTGVHSPSLLQKAFPTRGSNPGLLPHRQTLDCLSHQGAQYAACTERDGSGCSFKMTAPSGSEVAV